jgi:G3E family GTPase
MKLVLVGGFLGSGKTTAIQQAATALLHNGIKAAVITNDQGSELVDTGFVESFGIPTEQVTNGCFCCHYDQLVQSVDRLSKAGKPGVIFAESVGSCTDLVATIARPLSTFSPGLDVVICVFADASLLFSLVSGTSSFLNDEVRYIYKKQLEEADVLVVNKIDLLQQEELKKVRQVVRAEYPGKLVLEKNSLDQLSVKPWLKAIDDFSINSERVSLKMDYDVYARGEAMMAWLDEELEIITTDEAAYKIAQMLIGKIEEGIRIEGYFVGHLKFLIDDGRTVEKVSFTATTKAKKNSAVQFIKVNKVSLLINARVQAAPEQLGGIVSNAIDEVVAETRCEIVVNSLSSFQPAYPKPTHRIAD